MKVIFFFPAAGFDNCVGASTRTKARSTHRAALVKLDRTVNYHARTHVIAEAIGYRLSRKGGPLARRERANDRDKCERSTINRNRRQGILQIFHIRESRILIDYSRGVFRIARICLSSSRRRPTLELKKLEIVLRARLSFPEECPDPENRRVPGNTRSRV